MKIKIDGEYYEASRGEFILDVARKNNIKIPSLCHNLGLPGLASCRLCIVEVIEGTNSKVVTSCIYPIKKQIEVKTNSEKIIEMRKNIIMLLAVRSPENPYINSLIKEYGVNINKFPSRFRNDECILCGLCIKACDELGTSAISTVNRGITKKISTPYDEPSKDCIGCGACAEICPTGAIEIEEKNGIRTIWNKAFQLLQCSVCDRYFSTKEQFEYINNKLGIKDYEAVCTECKRKLSAQDFTGIFKHIR